MLKTLKWVYKLGYKHAENKLYHMLVNEINRKEQEFDCFMAQKKQDQAELERLESVRYQLKRVVDDVFKPNITESVQYFEQNRFEL